MKIIMAIEIEWLPDGRVSLGVVTAPFDPLKTPTELGRTWTGMCLAINDYARSIGYVGFDCIKPHGRERSADELAGRGNA